MTDIQSDLPDGWVWTTLGETCVLIMGQSPPSSTYNNKGIGLPFFQGKAEFGDLYPTPVKWCTEPKKTAEPNDVLISIRAPVGPTNLTKVVSCIGRGLAALRPELEMSERYFLYYLRSIEQDWSEYSTGTTFEAISGNRLAPRSIPLAPLNEQRRIVDAIESYFTRLDAAEAALRRAQAKLAQYKTALLKAACEGRLVPTEAQLARQEGRAYEPAEVLLARVLKERRAKWEEEEWARLVARAKQRAAADAGKATAQASGDALDDAWLDVPETAYKTYLPKDDKWKEKYQELVAPNTDGLPELPEGWCWAAVEQLGTVQLGRQRSPQNHQGPYMRPYLRAANATWHGLDITDVAEMNFPPEDFNRYQLHIGDILLSEASGSPNEVGKSFIWRGEIDGCCFQNTLIRVQTTGLPPEYIQLHFLKDAKTGRFGQIAKGVGIHHLGGQRLAEMAVALPPLAEQHTIISEYDRRITVVKAVESAVDTDLRRLAKFRQSILKQAFAGELVPQLAEDEPAHVLLDRIREEREARKNVETKTEKNNKKPSVKREISRESVLQTIEEMPHDTFAFDELRNNIAGNYETLRDVIFDLLGETPPRLTLKFDSELKSMVFVRGHA